MKEVSSVRGWIFAAKNKLGDLLFCVSMLAILFYKFHSLDITMSNRHVLTTVTFFGSIGVLLCLMSPLLALPGKARRYAMIALNFMLSLLILTDILYLRFYSDLFSLRNLALTGQMSEIADSILALMKPLDLIYFADIPLFLIAAIRVPAADGVKLKRAITRMAASCALFFAGWTFVAWKIDDYDRAVRGAIRSLWDRPSVAVSTGTLVYHFADARNIIDETLTRQAYAAEDEKKIHSWLAARNKPSIGDEAPAAGKNLIIIQVESLQGFTVGLTMNDVEVTPNINRLTQESLYFPKTYNQTASGNSSDAEFMVNTSLFPTAKGVAYMRFAKNKFHSLGTTMKSMGYRTIAFHGDRPGFWNRNHMYPSLGFERYITKNEFVNDEGIGLGLSDRSFFEQSLGYLTELRDGGKPFFAFLVTLTSHYPFNFAALREQVTDLPLGDLEDTMLGNYLRSVHYTDKYLGLFIEGLSREGLLENSVVVVYGDHPAIPRSESAALGELLGRNLSSSPQWRSVQQVPLLIRIPGGHFLGTIDTPTGQMDVGPTLASIMGFSLPGAFGRNLMNTLNGDETDIVVFRNGSYVLGDVLVTPQDKLAFDLDSMTAADYDEFYSVHTAEATRRLSYSDYVLENNLLRRLNLAKAAGADQAGIPQ